MSINLKTRQLQNKFSGVNHIQLQASLQVLPVRLVLRRYSLASLVPLPVPGSANVPAMKLGLDMVFETHGFCNCRLQKRGVFLVPESYRWEFIKQESAGVKQLAGDEDRVSDGGVCRVTGCGKRCA